LFALVYLTIFSLSICTYQSDIENIKNTEEKVRLRLEKSFLDVTNLEYYISDWQQQKVRALVVKLVDTKDLKAKEFTFTIVSDSLS
jgi:hypothetical protein